MLFTIHTVIKSTFTLLNVDQPDGLISYTCTSKPQTFGFFQFEMQGGIFHSCCSFTDTYMHTEVCNVHVSDEKKNLILFNTHLPGWRVQDRGRGRWGDPVVSWY